MVDDIYKKRLERKTSPDTIIANLLQASVFITAYELLKSEVVHKTIQFFMRPEDASLDTLEHPVQSREYRATVLALDTNKKKNSFRACCLWFAKGGVITDSDVSILLNIREFRNKLAHELPVFLIDPDFRLDPNMLMEVLRMLKTIGRFWVRMSVDSDPQFDHENVDDEDLWPNSSYIMSLVMQAIADLKR